MSNNCPTPHINALPGDFAPTVLMPGDPLRSRFIAESFLDRPVCVNSVRGIHGYTGTYKGVPVSVMASGMGMPSIGIYSHELFNFYGVESIIRVGTAGGMSDKVRVRDVILGMGACTGSSYAASAFGIPGSYSAIADFELLQVAHRLAEELGIRCHVGNLLSSDTFYSDCSHTDTWARMGVLAVEMEAAALYMNAARAGKRALAICTVSDHLLTGESASSDERQTSFTHMMELALSCAVEMSER